MPRRRVKVKDFLRDFRSGMDLPSLMTKYDLMEKDVERLCRRLTEQNLIPLIELMELKKLTDSQEMRAFREIATSLDGDE